MKLHPNETDLIGSYTLVGRVLEPDLATSRIQQLVDGYLQKLGTDATGWDKLYRDPSDGRLWELWYPESGLHGGGPPRLTNISAEAARSKYGDLVDKV